jgi:hypothetical protein
MNPAIETLIAKWAEPEGIPFKGNLISADGCMCAQGQALHYVGGWSHDRLRNVEQAEADRETARLLNISVAHVILLRRVNDSEPGAPSVVLTDPAQVLGDQAETVLAFWRHLDRMTAEQWPAAGAAAGDAAGAAARAAARAAAGDAAGAAARAAARAAAWDAAGPAAGPAAWDAAWDAAWAAAGPAAGAAAGCATNEIQGARILRERGQPFTFLPMFGFADPEAVLAAENDR